MVDSGQAYWRVEKATRAALIVDADEYFEAARAAMLKAKRRIILVGWDFDARISLSRRLMPSEPKTLGEFVLWLIERTPDLEVFLLRWDIGALRTLFRGTTMWTLAKWMAHKRIHVRLDSASPVGASHHHKIIVIDDCFAFCGGIDMTNNRWDTRNHRDDDPRRIMPGGKPYGPWHDATTALEGPVAKALGDLARDRWKRATGKAVHAVDVVNECWPDVVECQFRDVAVTISRSRPALADSAPIREIEAAYLKLIGDARRHIYAESQYFASRRIAEAIGRRLAEPDGPEIVLINPLSSHGWLEPVAMDTARARLFEALHRLDRHGRFRLYHPYTSGGIPIYVHAKLMIVDDRVLHVGSSNMNNRSMRLDTECDVGFDADLPGNGAATSVIRTLRCGLLAEHLGVSCATVSDRIAKSGSLIETIEDLRGDGRSLRPYVVPNLGDVEKWLADNEVFDPEGPEEMFEAFSNRGLLRRLGKKIAPGTSGALSSQRKASSSSWPSQT